MSECLHGLCENNIKKKLFYCQKKVKKENLCCKKCNKKEDLVVCLRSMIVYCKNENHYLKKHHVLFYDMEKSVMICTYCDKIAHIITKDVNKDSSKKVKSNLKNNVFLTDEHVQKNDVTFKNDNNTLLCKFIELPRFPHKVLQGNIIKGFQNLGNTCYINSLFHILINISKFKRGIINENHPIQSCGTCIICNIKLIIKKMNTEKDLTLKYLVNCIMNFSSEYKNDDQHDIHTLYLNVVENIQNYTNKIEGNSFIDQLFYGNMNSTLRCLSCDFKRHTIEAFCSISLKHTKNLKDSLSEYFQDEHMEDKLHCLNCKDHTVFSKSLEVIQIPEILVIHILRFEFINTITKINNGIEIYEKIEFGQCNYVLKGFVQHRGSIEQGHYLSYIRFGTFWYEFDDNNVRKLSHKNVPFQDAYLLFYVKDKSNENVLFD